MEGRAYTLQEPSGHVRHKISILLWGDGGEMQGRCRGDAGEMEGTKHTITLRSCKIVSIGGTRQHTPE